MSYKERRVAYGSNREGTHAAHNRLGADSVVFGRYLNDSDYETSSNSHFRTPVRGALTERPEKPKRVPKGWDPYGFTFDGSLPQPRVKPPPPDLSKEAGKTAADLLSEDRDRIRRLRARLYNER